MTTGSRPGRPFLSMRWLDLLFAHWPLEPAVLRPLIPAGLELDTFDGSAWLGVVPFRMTHVRPFELPLPGQAFAFAEVNVRTYVTAPDGTRGIWFLSLDGAHWPSATAARLGFGVPYHHARVTASTDGDWIARRARAPSVRPAELRIRYRPTGPVRTAAAGSLEAFLTDRMSLFAVQRGRVTQTPVEHAAVAAPGRGGRDRAQHDGRGRSASSCRRRRPTCCSPAGWTPSPIAPTHRGSLRSARTASGHAHPALYSWRRMRGRRPASSSADHATRLSVVRTANLAMSVREASLRPSRNAPQWALHSGHDWMARSTGGSGPLAFIRRLRGRVWTKAIARHSPREYPGCAGGGRVCRRWPGAPAVDRRRTRAATISAWRTS